MSSKKVLDSLYDKVEHEEQRHIAHMIRIMAKAKALRLRGKITEEEYNKLDNQLGYRRLANIGLNEYVENLIQYRYALTEIYSRIIEVYKKYKTGFQLQESFPNLEQEMEEFFKYLNCYQLYKRIKDRCMIINDPNATLNVCINGGKTSYIVLKKPYINHQKPKSFTLVHEMGHAYYYNIVANQNTNIFARDINSEIISIFFERMYLKFLLEHLNNPEMIKSITTNLETRLLNLTIEAKQILDMFDDPNADYSIKGAQVKYYKKGEEHTTDLYGQTYAIGNLASTKMLCEYEKDPEYFLKHFPELIKAINDMTFETTLIEHTDLESLDRCLDKNLTLKLKRKGV